MKPVLLKKNKTKIKPTLMFSMKSDFTTAKTAEGAWKVTLYVKEQVFTLMSWQYNLINYA